LTAYFTGNISTTKYQNTFTYVKVIASQKWDVFETGCRYTEPLPLPNCDLLLQKTF